ncbi:MAG: hypothetical protein IPM56_02415 [Ignavibacteriales bacterium]|nr:MAG: hypothetical protein IPM56_02415 [Ignavibacteriales bacterium]
MESLKILLEKYSLGDLASIFGLIITIIGFVITFIKVRQSKNAAELAQVISLKLREDLQRTDTVIEFSAAIISMDEIKRLHRQRAWEILPERYTSLRKSLISIKSSNDKLSIEQMRKLQSAIQNLKSIEEQVDFAIIHKKEPDNVDKLNKIIALQADKLTEVLIEIRNKIGT